MSEVRQGRDTKADKMVSDMVSWLRRNGKQIALKDNGQIRFFWESGSQTVKVSYQNTEGVSREQD